MTSTATRRLEVLGSSLMPSLERSRLQLQARHLAMLDELLAAYVPDAQVWAYGSRVTGGCHEGSDLDIVLRNPADLQAHSSGLAALRDALTDSRLPILVDVHDWALLPVAFQRNIEQGYVQLQAGKTPAHL